MWNLPGPGVVPTSPALAGGFLTTGPLRGVLKASFDTMGRDNGQRSYPSLGFGGRESNNVFSAFKSGLKHFCKEGWGKPCGARPLVGRKGDMESESWLPHVPLLQACSPSGKIQVRFPQVVWQRLGYLLLSMTFSSLRTPTHPLRRLLTVPVKVMPSHLFFSEHLVLMPGLALLLDHNQLWVYLFPPPWWGAWYRAWLKGREGRREWEEKEAWKE